jgi:hypothetical protein
MVNRQGCFQRARYNQNFRSPLNSELIHEVKNGTRDGQGIPEPMRRDV